MPDSYLSEYPFYSYADRKFRYARDHVLGQPTYNSLMLDMMVQENYNFDSAIARLFMKIEDLKSLSADGHDIGLHSSSHLQELIF